MPSPMPMQLYANQIYPAAFPGPRWCTTSGPPKRMQVPASVPATSHWLSNSSKSTTHHLALVRHGLSAITRKKQIKKSRSPPQPLACSRSQFSQAARVNYSVYCNADQINNEVLRRIAPRRPEPSGEGWDGRLVVPDTMEIVY